MAASFACSNPVLAGRTTSTTRAARVSTARGSASSSSPALTAACRAFVCRRPTSTATGRRQCASWLDPAMLVVSNLPNRNGVCDVTRLHAHVKRSCDQGHVCRVVSTGSRLPAQARKVAPRLAIKAALSSARLASSPRVRHSPRGSAHRCFVATTSLRQWGWTISGSGSQRAFGSPGPVVGREASYGCGGSCSVS